MSFNNNTKLFRLSYKPNYNKNIESKIYINTLLHYPYGYEVAINPLNSAIYTITYKDNIVNIYNSNTSCYDTININITPKKLYISA